MVKYSPGTIEEVRKVFGNGFAERAERGEAKLASSLHYYRQANYHSNHGNVNEKHLAEQLRVAKLVDAEERQQSTDAEKI